MWTRLMVAAAVTAFLASACGETRKRLGAAEEVERAAEKRAQELRVQRAALLKELAELRTRATEAGAKTRAAKVEWRRTLAAAGLLKAAGPGGLASIDATHALAAERFEAAAGNLAKVTSVVSDVTHESWPCVGAPRSEDGAPACQSSPYEDACAGVPEYDSPVLEWRCPELLKAADAPALAFCTAEIPSRELRGPVTFSTNNTIIRTAFFHGGHVMVSDLPEPGPTTYHPRNEDGLSSCQSENQRRSCAHDCEVRFDRYHDPCAESYGCGGCCGDGDWEPPEGESEDPQVTAARVEARRAEAEAAEAAERARVARQEVDYQECLSGCTRGFEPPGSSAEVDQDVPPTPDSSTTTTHLAKSPAPGVLVVEEEDVTRAGDAVLQVETRTMLLLDDALAAARAGSLVIDEATKLGSLRQLEVFQDARAPEVAKAWKSREKPEPGAAVAFVAINGQQALAGLRHDGTPAAWAFSSARGDPAARAVDQQVLCASVAAAPSGFGAAAKGLASACERAARAGEEATKFKDELAALANLSALMAWKTAVDSSKLLTSAQKQPLLAAFDERRRDLVKAEVERLLERLKGIDEGESLTEWAKERTIEGATADQVSLLKKAFHDKEDALRKAGTLRARKAAGPPDALVESSGADAGGSR